MFKDNTTEHLTVDGCKEVLQEWLGKRKFKAMSRMMWLRPLQLTCVATFVSVYSLSISNIGRNWIEMVHNQQQSNIWMKVGGYHDYICIRGTKTSLLRGFIFLHLLGSEMTLPHSSSVCIRLWPLLFSGPMQMKRVSPAEIVKQHRLMFLCGPKMWMFTVDRGLIAFLRQLKSIGPLMGPIKQWEKPNVTMGLIVSEWTHLALCGEWKCVAY